MYHQNEFSDIMSNIHIPGADTREGEHKGRCPPNLKKRKKEVLINN